MKFIKCLRKHSYSDYVGISLDVTKDPEFYLVNDILQNKFYLFNYTVTYIRVVNGKLGIALHDEPVVLYYLGI